MKLHNAITVPVILIVLISNCYAIENKIKKNKVIALKNELCFVADFNTKKSGNILKNVHSIKCPVSNK